MKRVLLFCAVIFAGVMPAAAEVAIPCAGDAVTKAPGLLVDAERAFRASWLDSGPNWYSAFEVRPPKRNIFDKSAETEPPLEPVKGIAWAHGLYCLANVSPSGDQVLVRYYARVAAFHEGQSWSRPFDQGLLAAFLARREGEAWKVAVVAGERTILLPGAVLSRPAVEAVPPPDARTGIPCRTGAAWNGARCVDVAVSAKVKGR